MKKSLITLAFSLCLFGCDDFQEKKTDNHSIFIQFNDVTSQWRGFDVDGGIVRWFSSDSCKITAAEPIAESLRGFQLDESGEVRIYSHPSLGEFLSIKSLDEKTIYATMKSGNKMNYWGVLDYDRIGKCLSFSDSPKYNL